MKVLHIAHQMPPETQGGVESHVRDLARSQADAGHEVRIITGSLHPWEIVGVETDRLDGIEVDRIHRSDLYFDSWNKIHCPEVGRKLTELVTAFEPDLVHVHHWIRLTQDIVVRMANLGIPVVLTLHDFASSCPRAFRMRPTDEAPCFRPLSVESCLDCVPRRPWETNESTASAIEIFRDNNRVELEAADVVLCATTSVRDLILEVLSLEGERFKVVPLGYERRFAGPAREVGGAEPFRFGFWGSITYRKGVHLLIEAFRSVVASRNPGLRPISLEILGEFDLPELEDRLRRAATDLPIRFHGRYEYEQLRDLGLSAAAFPSICIETYGLVLDEAFELGLPVVVPDIGALPDRAGDGGLKFVNNDAGDLARKLGAVADDENIRARLIAALPSPSPDASTHLTRIMNLYEEAREHARTRPDDVTRISDDERAQHAFEQHETLFRRLIETEGPDLAP